MGLSRRSRTIRSILVIFIILAVFQAFQHPVYGSLLWSSPTLIAPHPGLDILPSAVQASNGTLWLAWQSTRNSQSNGRTDIIYKTNTNGIWSIDHNLTTSGWNSGPSLVQLSNGTILAFWSIKSGTSFLVYSSLTNGRSWSTPVQITQTVYNDTLPSAAVARDGTIWLVWTRVNGTNLNIPLIKQIFYKTYKNGVWSSEAQLTTDSVQNHDAGVMVGKDGVVRVVWSKGAAGTNYQIFSKYYNGATWSPDKANVTSAPSSTDDHPAIMQDRNGTLWIFWERLIVVSSLIQYYEVWGKSSYDMGKTWTPDTQLTPTPGSVIYDSFTPFAVQTSFGVKSILLFYSSNFNISPNYNIFDLTSTAVNNVYDVSVTGVYVSNNLGTSWEYPGGLPSIGQTAFSSITVTVKNTGDFPENITVILSVTNSSTTITVGSIHQQIGPGGTWNFYFYWNTNNAKPARYGLAVNIPIIQGETFGNFADNSFTATNQVHIIPLGDVDQDGGVQITDLSVVLYDYGFSSSCGCSRYNPYADVHNTGTIDIVDLGVVLANFNLLT
jgi:hypothetical protein